MPFEEFRQWLSQNLLNEKRFHTLGERSFFDARYDQQDALIRFRLKTGNQGQLRTDQIQEIFERWEGSTSLERYKTSFYTDPKWPNTPNRIFAPTIPAIIRFWMHPSE